MKSRLPTAKLRWRAPASAIDIKAAEAHEDKSGRPGALGQDRALAALELGLGIKERGFNIFVVGASGTGRTSTLRTVLTERAKRLPAADDVVLVYNFDDRDHPHAIQVPAGRGQDVKRRYETMIEAIISELEKEFESDGYLARRAELEQAHTEAADAMLEGVEKEATEAGFILSRTGGTLTLGVADETGAPLTEEAYEALSAERKAELEERAEALQGGLEEALRKVRGLERETDERMEALARETANVIVIPHIESTKSALSKFERLTAHLNDDWRIVSSTAMGGTGGATAPAQFAALVVLEREETKTVGGFSAS